MKKKPLLDDPILGNAVPLAGIVALWWAGAGAWSLLVYAVGVWEYARGMHHAYNDAQAALDQVMIVVRKYPTQKEEK